MYSELNFVKFTFPITFNTPSTVKSLFNDTSPFTSKRVFIDTSSLKIEFSFTNNLLFNDTSSVTNNLFDKTVSFSILVVSCITTLLATKSLEFIVTSP